MKIEWLIIADFAEVINNKLYLQGGGWDKLTVNTGFPFIRQIGIAASINVPWNETNQDGTLRIEILTQDAKSLAKMEGKFRVGRPADHPPGEDQRAQIAASLGIEIETEGVYVVSAHLEDQEEARVKFSVVPGPALAMRKQIESERDPPQQASESPGNS